MRRFICMWMVLLLCGCGVHFRFHLDLPDRSIWLAEGDHPESIGSFKELPVWIQERIEEGPDVVQQAEGYQIELYLCDEAQICVARKEDVSDVNVLYWNKEKTRLDFHLSAMNDDVRMKLFQGVLWNQEAKTLDFYGIDQIVLYEVQGKKVFFGIINPPEGEPYDFTYRAYDAQGNVLFERN